MQNKYLPYMFVFIVLVSLLFFYTAFDKKTKAYVPENLAKVLSLTDMKHSLRELNKVAGLASIGLIASVFLLGPLARVFPGTFGRFLYFRKPVGIMGFLIAALHGIYSAIEFYQLDIERMFFTSPKAPGVISGIVALAIFLVMTLTSNKVSVERLGYGKWKIIQTFGYVGLFFATLHFYILESKPETGLDVRPFGLVFFYLPIVALVARVIVLFTHPRPKKKYEEHFAVPKKQKIQ